MARTVFKTAEAGASRLVGSIPTLSRHSAENPYLTGFLAQFGRSITLTAHYARLGWASGGVTVGPK